MADTVADVLIETSALLNDQGKLRFPNSVMLPYLNKAYRELQTKSNKFQLQQLKETDATLTLPVGETELVPPADLVSVVSLSERPAGSSDKFVGMTERTWEPDINVDKYLRVWTWREEFLKFPGATNPVEIFIRYYKSLDPLDGDTSLIFINNGLTFLAARTGALVARFIGENSTRADELDADAGVALDDYLSIYIRTNQGRPTRRQRTRYRVPN